MVPALAGYPLGTIPRYLCEIRKIQIEDRRLRQSRGHPAARLQSGRGKVTIVGFSSSS